MVFGGGKSARLSVKVGQSHLLQPYRGGHRNSCYVAIVRVMGEGQTAMVDAACQPRRDRTFRLINLIIRRWSKSECGRRQSTVVEYANRTIFAVFSTSANSTPVVYFPAKTNPM